jgi:UDP-N-acetylmuramate--alanine ligase
MNLQTIKAVHFLGIGGIGMSALARFFHTMGKTVSGYDKTETTLTQTLQQEGIVVYYEENSNRIPEQVRAIENRSSTVVVWTPAVPTDHAELVWFRQHEYTTMKRAEVLGLITKSTQTIAIAGTHGKTTTTTLTAHLLRTSGIDCSAFLGGISGNYGTNLLLSKSLGKQQTDASQQLVVVEADEYDRSFLWLHPKYLVITSVDADHLDIYGDVETMHSTYQEFIHQIKPEGKLITKPVVAKKLQLKTNTSVSTYALEDVNCVYTATDIRIEDGHYLFSLSHPKGQWQNLILGLPGRHNVENAVAAAALAISAGANEEGIRSGLASFKGVARRFDVRYKTEKKIYIDDYGHHPEELSACIRSVHELYPDKRILGIFQPHLFSRTRDFLNEFAQVLSQLDELILLDIYPAREHPIPGITSGALARLIQNKDVAVQPKTEIVESVLKSSCSVILTMGAGDIDQLVEPIEKALRDAELK